MTLDTLDPPLCNTGIPNASCKKKSRRNGSEEKDERIRGKENKESQQ